jgi:hypothetical protein
MQQRAVQAACCGLRYQFPVASIHNVQALNTASVIQVTITPMLRGNGGLALIGA